MDWIEEQVQKWKKHLQDTGLLRSMIWTMVLFAVAGSIVYVMFRSVCGGWMQVIMSRYETLALVPNMSIGAVFYEMSFSDALQYLIVKTIYTYGFGIFILIAEFAAVLFQYKNKMKSGVTAVQEAVEYLTLGDYGHEQMHRSKDELGVISNEIEALRQQLMRQRQLEWNAQMEQSSINAAFAHDLRTPLTVMKGYTEFLLKYVPQGKVTEENLLEKLETIHQQQERLLEFSKTMTQIQHIEMRDLHCKWMPFEDLVNLIRRTTQELEIQYAKTIQVAVVEEQLGSEKAAQISVDETIIMEICENLLTNAIRYAETAVEVQITRKEGELLIFIKDDGKGFSAKSLKEAKSLYYSEEKGQNHHFGMGLYICEKLCEKHGGKLTLVNGVQGGAICAAQFQVLYK